MKRQKRSFNSALLRYQRYCNKLVRLHKTGKNKHRQSVLKRHIERLYRQLEGAVLPIAKRTAIAAGFAAIMTLTPNTANSQVAFQENTINQFSLAAIPGPYSYASLAQVDLDNDGDLDILTGHYDGNFRYYENTGTASAPDYAPFALNPFSLVDAGSYSILTVADLDNDGDKDILANQYGGGVSFKYFENTGTASAPTFAAPVNSPFGLSNSAYAGSMQLLDIDADNDLDLYLFNGGSHYYFENTGSSSSPTFAAAVLDPFSLSSTTYQGRFFDFDNDGDLDILGASTGVVFYFENTGTPQNATFATGVVNPFSIQITFPNIYGMELLDIDGDGDMDMMYNNSETGDFHYYENIGTVSSPVFSDGHTNLFSLETGGSTPDPTFGDLDNDGDLDMLTEVNGVLYYFENTGDAVNPDYPAAVQNPFSLPGYGNNGHNCVLVDIDGDSDLDLFMAYSNNFQYLENIGTASNPNFGSVQSAPFGIQNGNGFLFPEFTDLDNDGDMDILTQSGIYGDVYYYQNTGTANSPTFAAPLINPFGFVAQGDRSNLTVGDVDGDGDFDVLAGKNEVLTSDEFFYYENIGTASSPNFALSLSDPFNLRPVGSNQSNAISTAPALVDLDNDGDMDLMIGVQAGYYTYFENVSGCAVNTTVNINGVTLTAAQSNAISYQWVDCDNGNTAIPGATSQSFTATANGNYACQISLSGCNDVTSCTAITTVSLDELNSETVEIYPNPASTVVAIQTDDQFESVSIFNVSGRFIRTEMSAVIDISDFSPGVYLLNIKTSGGITTRRLVKH